MVQIISGIANSCVGVFNFIVLEGVVELGLGRQSNVLDPSDFDVAGDNGGEKFKFAEN